MSDHDEETVEILPGVVKDENQDYVLYYIETLSDSLKNEIRNRLIEICHGADRVQSGSKIYSYKATLEEFISRYKTNNNISEDRKKGMIGELLVHVILEIEGHFITVSPFFNMEERSFRKGFDILLFEEDTGELWIAEIKSGSKQKRQRNASSAAVSLVNTAKNNLKTRLNEPNTSLWLNAINAAKTSMSNGGTQKDAVVKLLEQCADSAVDQTNSSNDYNVVLAGMLFHTMSERMMREKIAQKYDSVLQEKLFRKLFIIAIQKGTFEAVYDFLDGEAKNAV